MTYSPRPVPASIERAAQTYLADEFRKVRDALDVVDVIRFQERNAEPSKISDGMVLYADGSNWNPGDGEGLYARINGAWDSLRGLQADEAETISASWTFSETVYLTDPTIALEFQTTTGNDHDIRWTLDSTLTALLRWDTSENIFRLQDRTGTATNVFNFDLENRQLVQQYSATDFVSYTMASDAFTIDSTQHIRLSPAAGHAVQIFDPGNTADFRVYDGTGADYIELRHDGSNPYIETNAGTIQVSNNTTFNPNTVGPMVMIGDGAGADSDVLLRLNTDRPWDFRQLSTGAATGLLLYPTNADKAFYIGANDGDLPFHFFAGDSAPYFWLRHGAYLRQYDSTNNYYSAYTVSNNTKSPNSSHNWDSSQGGTIRMQAISINDDATATFQVDSHCILFLVTTYNRTTYAAWFNTTTQTPVTITIGSLVTLQTTNADVDGKINIWNSAGGEVSIKNRLGSTRTFYLYMLGQ